MGLLALALFASGCYGPFNLTRRIHHWNGQVGGKWENEIVFLIFAWVPVYGFATLGDAVVFNSIEFWTGENPVDPPMMKSALPQQKRIARGNEEALLTYTPTPEGVRLLIEQFRHGQRAGSLRIQQRDDMTVGSDAEGRVLLTAQSLSDGSVLIRDGDGKQAASYSADQVERFLKSARQ
jgi:hypothetical protein